MANVADVMTGVISLDDWVVTNGVGNVPPDR